MGILIYLAFWVLFLIVWQIADRAITSHRLKINQYEWDEYSKGMTRKEKDEVFLNWLHDNQIKHGWMFLYIPCCNRKITKKLKAIKTGGNQNER